MDRNLSKRQRKRNLICRKLGKQIGIEQIYEILEWRILLEYFMFEDDKKADILSLLFCLFV